MRSLAARSYNTVVVGSIEHYLNVSCINYNTIQLRRMQPVHGTF